MVGLSQQKAKSLEESLKRLMELNSPRIVEEIVKEILGIVISGVSIKLISFFNVLLNNINLFRKEFNLINNHKHLSNKRIRMYPTEDLARFFKLSGDLEFLRYLEMIFDNLSSLALAMATAEL